MRDASNALDAEDALITTNPDGVIRRWSQAARRVWGYSAEEAVGRHVSFLCCSPEANWRRAGQRAAADEALGQGSPNGRFCGLLTAGDVHISVLRDEAGRHSGYAIRSKGVGLCETTQAVAGRVERGGSGREAAEDAGRRQEFGLVPNRVRLEGLLRHLPGVVHSCLPEYPFITTFASHQVARLFGYSSEDFKGIDLWFARIHPDDLSGVLAAVGRLHESSSVTTEYRFRHRDGTYREVRDTMSAVHGEDGGIVEIVGYWEDITEEKHLERARQERERLRVTALAALDGQETERARISRELHDDVNQRLAVLILDVNALEAEVGSPQEPLCRELNRIRGELKDLSRDVHDLALRLHPPRLEGKGLADAIVAECTSLAERTGIELHFTVGELPSKILPLASLCLYRVAKEALNNVVKHSGTQRGRVTLESAGGCLRLSIEDFGVGFDQQNRHKFGGLGIMTMEERVRVLGGTFSLHSKTGQGTCVTATVPLSGGVYAESADSLSG
ncbi:MAG: PAS domain-containing protein [Bryobacterales bacterium]|nr:PAS domain-containing protein [Bryobacterales bacterium]